MVFPAGQSPLPPHTHKYVSADELNDVGRVVQLLEQRNPTQNTPNTHTHTHTHTLHVHTHNAHLTCAVFAHLCTDELDDVGCVAQLLEKRDLINEPSDGLRVLVG